MPPWWPSCLARPVALCLHEGTLFVPENLSDGTWDVICYVVADGSTPAQLLNGDGQPSSARASFPPPS